MCRPPHPKTAAMGSRKYLVIFYAVSSGLNGPLLGTDEQEIVLLVYLVLDTINNKVAAVFLLYSI